MPNGIADITFRDTENKSLKKLSVKHLKRMFDIIQMLYPERNVANEFLTGLLPEISGFITPKDRMLLPILGYEVDDAAHSPIGVVLTNSQVLVVYYHDKNRAKGSARIDSFSATDFRCFESKEENSEEGNKTLILSMTVTDMKKAQYVQKLDLSAATSESDAILSYYDLLRNALPLITMLPRLELMEKNSYELEGQIRVAENQIRSQINNGLPMNHTPETLLPVLENRCPFLASREGNLVRKAAASMLRKVVDVINKDKEKIVDVLISQTPAMTMKGQRLDCLIFTTERMYAAALTKEPAKPYEFSYRGVLRTELTKTTNTASPYKLSVTCCRIGDSGMRYGIPLEPDCTEEQRRIIKTYCYYLRFNSRAEAMQSVVRYQMARNEIQKNSQYPCIQDENLYGSFFQTMPVFTAQPQLIVTLEEQRWEASKL